MTTQIKICGLTTPDALRAATAAGATHVGFVHYEPSPRHLPLEEARRLRSLVPGHVKAVLLLVSADIETTARAIDIVQPNVVQFHGAETPEWIALVREKTGVQTWKALGIKDAETLANSARFKGAVDRLLFDAPARALPGGNGEAFRWDLLTGYEHTIPWGLAGGLTPENVASAIRQTGTELVDTSSGVESAPGVKDVDLIRAFCKAALEA